MMVMLALHIMGSWRQQFLGPDHHVFTSHPSHKRVAGTLILRGNFWYLSTLLGRLGRRSCCTFLKSGCPDILRHHRHDIKEGRNQQWVLNKLKMFVNTGLSKEVRRPVFVQKSFVLFCWNLRRLSWMSVVKWAGTAKGIGWIGQISEWIR